MNKKFYLKENFDFICLQINQSVASSRNAFMAWHEMKQQIFYVKLMLIQRPNHSNGHLTIRQKHLKCRKVITEYIHQGHQRYRIRQ
jgi:gluconate kinase